MFLNFRQGVVSGTNFISNTAQGLGIVASNSEPFSITLANGDQDILYTISKSSSGAFDLTTPVSEKTWLYANISNSGKLEYGYTVKTPVVSSSVPSSPTNDLHWFDKTTNQMKVYNSVTSQFDTVVRVFLATIDTSGTISYYAPGTSQVSISASYAKFPTGRIIFNDQGSAIYLSTGQFLTSTSDMFVDGGLNIGSNIESSIVIAELDENIGNNSVVKFISYGEGLGKVRLASYQDTSESLIGFVKLGGTIGERVNVIIQGLIINEDWDWQNSNIPVGTKLYIGINNDIGTIVPYDPQDVEPELDTQVPVAKVVSENSVYFDQGQGGIGARGPKGAPGDQAIATTTEVGGVILSTEPSDPNAPVVVEDSDPRLTDARPPTSHTHPGEEVIIDSFSSNPTRNLQLWIELLEQNKLNENELGDLAVLKTGGSMTGFLTLVDNPQTDFQAATKKYVDDVVSGGTGLVNSVFGRTGNVTAANGDYSASLVTETTDGDVQSAIDALRTFDSNLGTAAQSSTADFLQISNNGSDIQDPSLFRSSLELGTSAILDAGVVNGTATLDSGGKVPMSQLPDGLTGGLNYLGTWDADTNTPTIADGTGNNGDYYKISVAGTTSIDGISNWDVNDWIVFNGTVWQKLDNSLPADVVRRGDAISDLTNDAGYITAAEAPVQSVAGQTGTVVLTKSDITDFSDSDYATSAQGDLADTALQPGDISTISLDEFQTVQYSYQSAGFTATANSYYMIDVSSGGFTMTLPATPALEDTIEILLSDGDFEVNNLIVARNGETIEELAEDMTVDTNYPRGFKLYYNGSTWRVVT